MIRWTHRRSAMILLLVLLAWAAIETLGLNAPATRSADGETIIVRDGDTMTIGDGDVRLYGIDAPEYAQSCTDADGKQWACGKDAQSALAALVKGRVIACEERATDKYSRVVASCRDERDADLSAALVAKGLAISPGRFDDDGPYAAEQSAARDAKRGIWAGSFDLPSTFRAKHPRGAEATDR